MKYPLLLALSFLLLPSCASWPTTEDLDRWKANTDKTLAAAAQLADGAKAAADAAHAKVAALEAAQDKILDEVEAISGPLDKNGDGDVTLAEAKAAYSELQQTPDGQNLLANWETYAAILASVAGIGVARRGGAAALARIHSAGRALVNKGANNGGGSPGAA